MRLGRASERALGTVSYVALRAAGQSIGHAALGDIWNVEIAE